MLAGRSQRAAWHRGYPFLLKRRDGILVRERVLTCDAGPEWYIHALVVPSSIILPMQIPHYLFIAHYWITYVRITHTWVKPREEK